MSSRTLQFLIVALFGLVLAVTPLGLSGSGLGMTAALAKDNGNGNGNGGGNGKGRGNDHGGGGLGKDLSADDNKAGKGHGKGSHGKGNGTAVGFAKAENARKGAAGTDESIGRSLEKAWGQAKKDLNSMMAGLFGEETGKPSASQLGRLNGFMHASPQAIANASPNSAVGSVAQTYRDTLAAHLGATVEEPVAEEPVAEEPVVEEPVAEEPVAEEPVVEEPVVEEPVVEEAAPTSLEAAAKALVDATNKPLDPAVVAEVNARLAEMNPDEPAFDGLEDPTSEQAQSVAQEIAEAAQSFESEETDQGLGNTDLAEGEDENEEETAGEDAAVEGETDLAEQSSGETTLAQ